MKALLIDDESSARLDLRNILERLHPTTEIVGQAADIREGLRKINDLKPDLLFLDIEMPGGSGLDLMDALPVEGRPEVIFVTARKRYGLDAIRHRALDYILKPPTEKALAEALSRATERMKLRSVLRSQTANPYAEMEVGIPGERGTEFVRAGDIKYCSTEDRYTRFHLRDGTTRLSSYPLGKYRETLPDSYFYLTHRSCLVNQDFVTGKVTRLQIKLTTGETVPVSRLKKAGVENWLRLKK